MSSNYETLYGVGLLDDLHNYFPALLYDSSSFASVRDVLGYMQQQTRARFDLFSYGLREYQASAEQPVNRRVVRTSFASMPAAAGANNSTLPHRADVSIPPLVSETTPRTPPSIQVELSRVYDENEDADEEDNGPQVNTLITNALLNLLQLPNTTLTRNYRFAPTSMDQFLQPIVVHPTQEQIDANTTVGNLVSDTEHSCAICQDALASDQEGRKLNACGHWFHRGCIDTWLASNVHCPVCRHDIREPSSLAQ